MLPLTAQNPKSLQQIRQQKLYIHVAVSRRRGYAATRREETVMKRIVLCFDGTWNKPSDENLPAPQQVETNVSRFFKSVSDAGRMGRGK